MREGQACVGGAESRQGAALVWVEETFGPSVGGQLDPHYPFKDFRNGFKEDNHAEGPRGVIGGLAGFVQDHPIGSFQ